MPATRYTLVGTKGMPFARRLTVNLRDGSIVNATFPTRVFQRHDETGAVVAAATTEIVDAANNIVEMRLTAEEMDKLSPDTVYAYQIDGQAQDQYIETIAHGRFYVQPRYSHGGGTA